MKPPRTLESLAQGEVATIRQILFDGLRSHCAERGLREGQRVSAVAADVDSVVVDTASGAIPCERRYARFIQVTPGSADPVEESDGADTAG